MGIKKVYTEVFKYLNLVWHVFVGLETTVKQIEKDKKKKKQVKLVIVTRN